MATMSSVFGISAADIERRLPEFIPQGRALACYVSSIAILMIIFMNSHFFLPDFPGWLFLGVLLTAAVMIRYASFQQQSHRPHPQAPHDELSGQQVDVPTFVTREQLPDIRIQLAHLNREFDDSDYDALRALDEDINRNVFGMSEEEINAIPIYKYQVQSHPHSQAKDCTKVEGRKFEEIEFTCSICMEQVNEEELIRRLRCSHEFYKPSQSTLCSRSPLNLPSPSFHGCSGCGRSSLLLDDLHVGKARLQMKKILVNMLGWQEMEWLLVPIQS